MNIITIEKCRDTKINAIPIKNSNLFWICSRHIGKNLCATNISVSVLNQLKGYHDNKITTNKQIQKLNCSLPKLLKDDRYNAKYMYFHSDIAERIIRNYSTKKNRKAKIEKKGKKK